MKQFINGLRRQNDIRLVCFRQFDFLFDKRQSTSIRSDQAELVTLKAHQNAIEHKARFIRRGGIAGFAQHFAEDSRINAEGVFSF